MYIWTSDIHVLCTDPVLETGTAFPVNTHSQLERGMLFLRCPLHQGGPHTLSTCIMWNGAIYTPTPHGDTCRFPSLYNQSDVVLIRGLLINAEKCFPVKSAGERVPALSWCRVCILYQQRKQEACCWLGVKSHERPGCGFLRS